MMHLRFTRGTDVIETETDVKVQTTGPREREEEEEEEEERKDAQAIKHDFFPSYFECDCCRSVFLAHNNNDTSTGDSYS